RGVDFPRDLAVASRSSRRDGGDSRPDAALERGAGGRERKAETELRVGEVGLELRAGALGDAVAGGKRRASGPEEDDLGQPAAGSAYAEQAERCRQLRLE